MLKSDALKTYQDKRDFSVTSEPQGGGKRNETRRSFVIQKHWATRLHYDFRLELNGTMKSWAVPKGPSLDPRDKRMAVHVEDHPISYNSFEGIIPPKQYGAGKVIIWDKGYWQPLGDPNQGYREGNLKFELHGEKLHGRWVLVRMKGKEEQRQEPWLLIKEKDAMARAAEEFNIVEALPDSVAHVKQDSAEITEPARDTSSTRKNLKTRIAEPASGLPAGAVKAPLPATLQPQLATLLFKPPQDNDAWIYEIKFDGYRILARIENKKVRLYTRNGNDWTKKLPALDAALQKLNLADTWLDGEIVVLNEKGIPDFQALQGAFDRSATRNIVYYLFDVPFHGGFDLRAVPLVERKEVLRTLLAKSSSTVIRFSESLQEPPVELLKSACQMDLEGVIGKRKSSAYTSRRTADWIKLKCSQRQEFVIGGYTDPQGSRTGIGSLLLGVHDEKGKLQYAGNVGSGFNTESLRDIKQKLDAIARDASPFAGKTGIDRKAHWVAPSLIAEVSFTEWTDHHHVRHGVFHGLRTDKQAGEVTLEKPLDLPGGNPDSALPAKLKITHPDRIVDPSTQTTKIDLIHYYVQVAPLMMEHLQARPVSLVRAPDGISGQLFFQKHGEVEKMPGIKQLDRAFDPGHPALLSVATAEGLLSASQMNVIEFHTWNATISNMQKPDRMTFDLDPGEGVSWPAIQEGAMLVQAFLGQLQLTAFLKTSGGKGLHIVVPIKRLYGWDLVKDFSQAIVQHLARTLPKKFAARSGPKNRVGKIFIDYLRNGFGATTVCAWSARARPGLGVSVPVGWPELESLTGSSQWTIANIQSRLEIGNRPWKAYSSSAQTLGAAMKILGFKSSS